MWVNAAAVSVAVESGTLRLAWWGATCDYLRTNLPGLSNRAPGLAHPAAHAPRPTKLRTLPDVNSPCINLNLGPWTPKPEPRTPKPEPQTLDPGP